MSNALKQHLVDTIGFRNKTIKKIEKKDFFTLDTGMGDSEPLDGNFTSNLCSISIHVHTADELTVSFFGNVPRNNAVLKLIEAAGGKFESNIRQDRMQFKIRATESGVVRKISSAIKNITAPGAPWYEQSCWKHSVPKAVGSLNRLADILDNYAANSK